MKRVYVVRTVELPLRISWHDFLTDLGHFLRCLIEHALKYERGEVNCRSFRLNLD